MAGRAGCGVSRFYLLYLFPFCLNNLLTFIGIYTRNSFISLSRPQFSPALLLRQAIPFRITTSTAPGRAIVIWIPVLSRSALFSCFFLPSSAPCDIPTSYNTARCHKMKFLGDLFGFLLCGGSNLLNINVSKNKIVRGVQATSPHCCDRPQF